MIRKLTASVLGLFLILRLLPAFAIFWGEKISLPVLNILEKIGMRIPFVLFEYMMFASCALLFLALLRRKLLKTIVSMLIAVLLSFLVIWYPLYFFPQPSYKANPYEIANLCNLLIDQLNAAELSFSTTDKLPAKYIFHPYWMDALDITGLCSFLTGEALITPKLEPASRPFVAVHEYMHLQGHANEGAANIAAWEECMAREGNYADSARLWALRYGMGILRRDMPGLYETAMLRMDHETLQFYRQAGGAHTSTPPPEFLRRIYAALGIEASLQDYEILAPYLAAAYSK